MYFNKRAVSLLLVLLIMVACSPVSRIRKIVSKSPVFNKHFTGFGLYDLQKDRMLYGQNADRYFVPASNTKLFTFYTALQLLGDSIPTLKYTVRNDTFFFRGTGAPSLLHPDVSNRTTFDFLGHRPEKLVYVKEKNVLPHYGPGWAWDDYSDYYAAEKAAFPIYGNIVRFSLDHTHQLQLHPSHFRQWVRADTVVTWPAAALKRDLDSNYFSYHVTAAPKPFTQDVPFRYTPELAIQLLKDTLHKEVAVVPFTPLPGIRTKYEMTADSLYKRLMQESDNFIAEQLLLMCSSILFDSLRTESTIDYAKRHLLADLPDKPVWVDGSGLSRYNLFTPRSIINLLGKLYRTIPRERLFDLLAIGGRAGTIKNWYGADTPFVFAKTGSMSNVHCLSGYLLTKKGRILLFSFMHNNYTVSSNDLKKEMDKVLRTLYEKY